MRLEVPGILHPVIDCLDKFKKVVEGCFSWTLAPDFKERIEDFSQNYAELISYAKVSLCIYILLNNTIVSGDLRGEANGYMEGSCSYCSPLLLPYHSWQRYGRRL